MDDSNVPQYKRGKRISIQVGMQNPIGYFLYSFVSRTYFILVKLVAPFNKRAKDLVEGQKGLLQKIIANESNTQNKNIWFHVASLGEYEQGRPVMEALKHLYPNHRLVVTFFSPSGYQARQNDPLINAAYYLPFESKKNAETVCNAIAPVMAFYVKYDLWYWYIQTIKNNNVPLFLIAAQFRPNQIFFKKIGAFQRNILKAFTYIFCQNESSLNLLKTININQAMVSGDNRYDRVAQTVENQKELPFIKEFTGNHFTTIVGSSYEIEEAMVEFALQKMEQKVKFIIAPHFVNPERITAIQKRFKGNCITYSSIYNETKLEAFSVLIIDSIGLLAKLYKYGQLAFIGGGFKENGLHNSLEAAAFGTAICFGPKLKRFPEAQELVQQKIAITVNEPNDFLQILQQYANDENLTKLTAQKSFEFVQYNKGATQRVMDKVKEILT